MSGQFGVGGGIITKPAIRLLLGQGAIIAIGTPLPIIITTALLASYNYFKNNLVDIRTGLLIGLAGAPASILGALITQFINASILLFIAAILIILISLRYLFPGKQKKQRADASTNIYLIILSGLVAGFISGLLGVGGGFIIIPILTFIFGQNIKTAFGTSLLAITIIAIPGSIVHFILGNVNLAIVAFVVLGIIPGAYLGSRIAIALPARTLNILFGLLLIFAGAYLAINELLFLI